MEALKNDLADQAGIPNNIDLLKPDNIWGLKGQDLLTHYSLKGYSPRLRPPRAGTSGKAQVIELEGHPEILRVQYHPGGGVHGGSYIKYTMRNGSEVKVIDPSTYIPRSIGNKTQFYNQNGDSLIYDKGVWHIVK